MKTRVSHLFRIFNIEALVGAIIIWFLLLFTFLSIELDFSDNVGIRSLLLTAYYTYEETVAVYLFVIFQPFFILYYPIYYKSTIEVTATEDCLICSRKGKFLYKLYYSEIKDYREFTYGNYMKRVTALFVATEKCKRPCSILGVTAHRFKNRKCQLCFECVDDVSAEMAEYVIEKIEEYME